MLEGAVGKEEATGRAGKLHSFAFKSTKKAPLNPSVRGARPQTSHSSTFSSSALYRRGICIEQCRSFCVCSLFRQNTFLN